MLDFIAFFNSNFFFASVTVLVGGFAIYLYKKERFDSKVSAAKIILQEIRRAEDIIKRYKEWGQYQFTKRIIATNSWAVNIHYFVGNLTIDELDKVSDLYSTGEYLDSIISKVSDTKFETNLRTYYEHIGRVTGVLTKGSTAVTPQLEPIPQPLEGQEPPFSVPVSIEIPPPWKGLLDEITYKYEPIYHSEVCGKLKDITRQKTNFFRILFGDI